MKTWFVPNEGFNELLTFLIKPTALQSYLDVLRNYKGSGFDFLDIRKEDSLFCMPMTIKYDNTKLVRYSREIEHDL